MGIFDTVRYVFIGASFGTFFLSLIFTLFPDLYLSIEELVSKDILSSTPFIVALEGQINFLNDWIFKHRLIFGTLFTLLSLYNIKSLIVL